MLDEKLYFSSQPKVLFVCKEPYDDFWDDGQPYGRNVAIYEKFGDYENVYKNYVAYRTIADVLYAVHHDVCYAEVQRAQKTEVARQLLGAAIINVGKMPAQITSPDAHMKKVYDIWKPVLFEQIKYFSPDVIVFGYTMNLFRADLFADCGTPVCKMYGGDLLGSFIHEGKLLLDAFHPSARKNKAAYVDTIVVAVPHVAFPLEHLVHFLEYFLAQIIFLHNPSELQKRSRVGRASTQFIPQNLLMQ